MVAGQADSAPSVAPVVIAVVVVVEVEIEKHGHDLLTE